MQPIICQFYIFFLIMQKVLQSLDRGVKWTVAFYTEVLKIHSGPKKL